MSAHLRADIERTPDMHVTPVRRLAAGATATAILAAAFLIPAAVAAAEDLPAAVAEPAAAELAGPTPDALPEEPGTEPGADPSREPSEEPAAAPSSDEPAEEPAAEAPEQQLVPTAYSTDEPQDPHGAIAPGQTLDIPYSVTGARTVYAFASGAHLAVTLTPPTGGFYTLGTNGARHFGEYYWAGLPDGTWTLHITNTGAQPVTPEYDLSYATTSNRIDISSSVYAPELAVYATPVIGGVERTDLTMLSEAVGADGTVYAQPLLRAAPGSSQYSTRYAGLADGLYFVRIWTVVDGVTYQAARAIGVHAAESEPPALALSTAPATPNAAGWFSGTVTAILTGTDSGSGYNSTYYLLDGGPEQSRGFAETRVPITGDGEHTLRFRGRDNQGNYSDWQEATIRIDATAPQVALYGIADGARYPLGEEVFVEYQCGDATSGLDGDCVADLPDRARVDTTTPGDYTFTIQATDLAGNVTRIVRHYTVLASDTTDPVIEVDVPAVPASGWYLDEVTVRLTASDESGIRRIHYEYGTMQGTVSRDIEADTAEITFDRSQYYTLSYWAEDTAGNRSESRDLQLFVDATAPWIDVASPEVDEPSLLPDGHYAQNERVVIDFTCDDDASGIAGCEGTTPDGELLPTGTPGTHELRIVATDVAGHRTERVVRYTVDAAPAPAGGGSQLASTGSDGLAGGLALAVLLLGAGAGLAVRRRVRVR